MKIDRSSAIAIVVLFICSALFAWFVVGSSYVTAMYGQTESYHPWFVWFSLIAVPLLILAVIALIIWQIIKEARKKRDKI